MYTHAYTHKLRHVYIKYICMYVRTYIFQLLCLILRYVAGFCDWEIPLSTVPVFSLLRLHCKNQFLCVQILTHTCKHNAHTYECMYVFYITIFLRCSLLPAAAAVNNSLLYEDIQNIHMYICVYIQSWTKVLTLWWYLDICGV